MKALWNGVAFLLGLALAALGLQALAPAPRIAIVTPKLTYLDERGDDYDVLFLGSSRTYRQILPELFDRLMTEAGHPVRSFNLGIDGMRPPEDTFVLEHALKHRRKPLRWVFVECNPLRLSMRDEDRGTLRATYWHDTPRTATLFRRAFLADEKKRNWKDRSKQVLEAWPDFYEHAEYWFQNSVELGRGNWVLENYLFDGKLPAIPTYDLGARKDGYRPSESPEHMNAAQLAAYEKELASMREKPPRIDHADPVSQDELRAKRQLIERAGARMVLLIPPFTSNRFFHPKPGPDAPLLLNFSSPEQYPALFAPENHADSGHVNRAGAEIYTREIVRALLDHLD
jgi:hypothetical protein